MIAVVLGLSGCGGDPGLEDLHEFVQQVDRQSVASIEPLPEFLPYEAFAYGAGSKRSPFEVPVPVDPVSPGDVPAGRVRPDPERRPGPLERFELGGLTMVGMLSRDGVRVALILDPEGRVHPLRRGDYLGRDHGRVIAVGAGSVRMVEIVSNGAGGWLERSRTLPLAHPGGMAGAHTPTVDHGAGQ